MEYLWSYRRRIAEMGNDKKNLLDPELIPSRHLPSSFPLSLYTLRLECRPASVQCSVRDPSLLRSDGEEYNPRK